MDLGEASRPTTPDGAQPPRTRLQKQQVVLILVFVIWFPVYLVWVIPAFDHWVFRYLDSYPAELHVIPAIGLPLLVALAYDKVMMRRRRAPD